MCGIFGISQIEKVEDSTSEEMLRGLKKRGPDAQNFSNVSSNLVFGMTRLAINGIENIQNQPMLNSENGDSLVFNGEIYNFKYLRNILINLGLSFEGTSDTEVVLKAYQAWGTDSFQHLKGMFAIAIWDLKRETLILARDSLGEKPLYFKQADKGLVFCSSRELIRKHYGLNDPIPDIACVEFHQNGYLSRNKNLDGIMEIKPGSYYSFENQKLVSKSSFKPLRSGENLNRSTFSESVIQFDELLTNTIREEIASSEVSVGVFMSGGMDSTLIAKKAAEFQPGIEIFTAAFSEESFDESARAKEIAATFDSKHNVFLVQYSMDLIIDAVTSLDIPIADTSIVPFFALSGFASKTHKVCLTGDGGDELFGGYVTYQATLLNEKIKRFTKLAGQLKFVSNLLQSKQGKVDFTYKLRAFLENCNADSRIAHQSWRQIYSQSEVNLLFSKSFNRPADDLNPLWLDLGHLPLIEQSMAFDLQTWLLDDILIKSDRMSMANSLELRAPLLHPDIVQFAHSLPIEFKFSLIKRKRIIGEVFDLNFREQQITRGPKKGFSSPMAVWISQNPMDFKAIIFGANVYSQIEVERLFSEHLSKSRDNSYRIFVLLVWAIFLERRGMNC
jgi:asparagine synthase (glutamine-hydrolysing)